MEPIHVRFFGPYSLCSEETDVLADCPHSQQGGIYFWAIQMPDKQYRISYIGQTTRSFYLRTKEHLVYQLGGNYRIYDPEALKKGELKVVWGGLWGKGRRDKLPEFLERYEKLAPIVKASLYVQSIFVAPLECERRLLSRIEGAMAIALRGGGEASSLLPEDIRYQPRRTTEAPVNVTFEIPCRVQGLPTKIEA